MSATNLERCVTALDAAVVSTLSYSSGLVTDGRRAPTARGTKWAWIERSTAEVASIATDARLREYRLLLHLYRRAGDVQEEGAVDVALQADVEAMHDAYHRKGFGTWTTLTGLTTCEVEILQRDSNDSSRVEQEAILQFTFAIWESLA